jgi:hypothetical protein
LKWLKADKGAANEIVFANLAREAVECSLTSEYYKAKAREKLDKIDKTPIAGKIDKKIAKSNASAFVRKLSPSGLPREEVSPALSDEEGFRRAAKPGQALRYGLWWHDFVRQIPWNSIRRSQTAATADQIFERCRGDSPDAARSAREWRLLRDHLANDQNFLRNFSDATLVIHTELPFFWKLDTERCLEGFVDLAAQSGARSIQTGGVRWNDRIAGGSSI